jgi:hypothetical protein
MLPIIGKKNREKERDRGSRARVTKRNVHGCLLKCVRERERERWKKFRRIYRMIH